MALTVRLPTEGYWSNEQSMQRYVLVNVNDVTIFRQSGFVKCKQKLPAAQVCCVVMSNFKRVLQVFVLYAQIEVNHINVCYHLLMHRRISSLTRAIALGFRNYLLEHQLIITDENLSVISRITGINTKGHENNTR